MKIQALVGRDAKPFEYGNTFEHEVIYGRSRLTIGFDTAQDACVAALAAQLSGPFQLLYVLHTTRTGARLGRYESPELTADFVQEVVRRFGRFLAQDARHDFWIRSHDDDGTLVLDRHNIIYAYGPVGRFETALLNIGAHRAGLPRIPDPHVHYYHEEWDATEHEILTTLDWVRTPLRDVDVQHGTSSDSGQ